MEKNIRVCLIYTYITLFIDLFILLCNVHTFYNRRLESNRKECLD